MIKYKNITEITASPFMYENFIKTIFQMDDCSNNKVNRDARENF